MLRTVYVFASMLWCITLAHQSFGQSVDPQFSMYFFNPLYYNPAAAGSEGVTRFQLTHRTQWAGYQGTFDDGGAPSTQLFSFNMPLASIKGGVGLYALNDVLGPQTNQAVQLSYAYRAALKNGTLSIGIQAGVASQGINYDKFRYRDPNDPLLLKGNYSQLQPDLGAGVYYQTTDYWVGLSMKHINQAGFQLGADRSVNPLWRTMFLTAGYKLGLGYDLDIQPSILYQYSTNPGFGASSIGVNVLATYATRYWVGVSYRQQDAFTATAGLNLLPNNALRFGYAFDFTPNGKDVKSPTSHEILLSYSLPAPDTRKKPIVRTPRFRY